MGFLRRLLGRPDDHDGTAVGAAAVPPPADAADAERAYERELLRGEDERLDDLQRRQLRYADHAWRPPPQGGPRRADDDEAADPPDR